MKKTYTTN